jgi:PncC family amidohydrolase
MPAGWLAQLRRLRCCSASSTCRQARPGGLGRPILQGLRLARRLRHHDGRPGGGVLHAAGPGFWRRLVVNDTTTSQLCAQLAQALQARGWMLATAESCTGGMIAAACTDLGGSSNWFERGFVTYSNEAKTDLLGVDPALIAQHGAVSEVVARAMAFGAVRHSLAQVSVAVTGVAGPNRRQLSPTQSRWARSGSGSRWMAGSPARRGASTATGPRCGRQRCSTRCGGCWTCSPEPAYSCGVTRARWPLRLRRFTRRGNRKVRRKPSALAQAAVDFMSCPRVASSSSISSMRSPTCRSASGPSPAPCAGRAGCEPGGRCGLRGVSWRWSLGCFHQWLKASHVPAS